MEQDNMKKPQRSPVSTSTEPTPPAQVTPPAKVLTPQSPSTSHWCRRGSQCTRALPDYTCEDVCAFFVQAFWLCHSPVTILLHLSVSTASFPYTPCWWKSPPSSSFRVNTEGKHYETPPWKTRPLNFLQKANGTQSAAILHTPTSHVGYSRSSLPVHQDTKRNKEQQQQHSHFPHFWAVWPNVYWHLNEFFLFFFQPVRGSSPSKVIMTKLPGMLKSSESVFVFFVLFCFRNCGLQMYFL